MGQIVGAGLGLAGSFLGQRSQNKALKKAAKAAAFNPFNVSGPGGSSFFNTKNRTASFSLDPTSQNLLDLFGNSASGFAGGGFTRDLLPFTQGLVGLLPGLFSESQNASQVDPSIIQNLRGVLNPEIARQQGAAGGLFDFAANSLGGQGIGSDEARQLFGLGTNLLGGNFQDVAADRTAALRQLSAPFEEQARNDLFSSLFRKGQLGGPGGARAFRSFGEGLGQADLQRVLAGQDLAEGILGRNQQVGAGLASAGLSGLFQGAGFGLDAAQLGLGASTNAANLSNSLFSGEGLFSDLTNARATQRLNNAQGLFGFGLDAQSAELQNALQALQGFTGIINTGRGALDIGANLGQAGAAAGANQGQFLSQVRSPLGSALQGVGLGILGGSSGLASGGSGLGGLFSRIGGSAVNSTTNFLQNLKLGRTAGNVNPFSPVFVSPPASIFGPSGPPTFNLGGT